MARPSPTKRKDSRNSAYDKIEAGINKTGDIIHTGIGNFLGGVAEKAILGGRESTGKVPFSKSYQGRRRAKMSGIKGIAGNREF